MEGAVGSTGTASLPVGRPGPRFTARRALRAATDPDAPQWGQGVKERRPSIRNQTDVTASGARSRPRRAVVDPNPERSKRRIVQDPPSLLDGATTGQNGPSRGTGSDMDSYWPERARLAGYEAAADGRRLTEWRQPGNRLRDPSRH